MEAVEPKKKPFGSRLTLFKHEEPTITLLTCNDINR